MDDVRTRRGAGYRHGSPGTEDSLRARGLVFGSLILLLGSVVLLLAGGSHEACAGTFRLLPPNEIGKGQAVERVGIGKEGKFKEYFRIDQPCRLTLMGPGTLRFFVRAHVTPGAATPGSVSVSLSGLSGFPEQRWTVKVSPSRTWQYADSRSGSPTGGKKITLAIPGGLHEITVEGMSNTGDPVYGIFYYDGPPVPAPESEAAPGRVVRKPTKKPERKPAAKARRWRVNSNFALGVIYDDNICRYSDDTLDLFQSSQKPEKFAITNKEDVIFNSKIHAEFHRPLLFGQKTALRVRYQRWDYVENSIKTNDEFNLRFRQTFRRYDYLEATYTYAPDSYIKELSDRPPYTSRSVPREYLHFKITRNAFALGYRTRLYPWLALKAFGGRTLRFYNRPFLENDLWEWNGRVEADLKYKRFTTGLRYAYADVQARGYDEVGETLETSDNDSDGSYEKDTYRVRITYRPKKSAYMAGQVTGGVLEVVSGLFKTVGFWIDQGLVKAKTSQIYLQYQHIRQFYTSQRPLDVDPLHVGRLDKSNQIQALWSSKAIWNRISLEAAIRHTVRTADSPGGLVGEDPSEEKDYTGTRFWITAKRPLW